MEKFLRTLALSSGIAVVCISLTHVALGQSWLPDTQSVTASLDSQHRFYTALFLPYGLALVWFSRFEELVTVRLPVGLGVGA